MSYPGTLQILDRLAPTHIQKDSRGSWIGFIATLLFFAVCLAIFVPPVILYFKGNYYQSQYIKHNNSTVSLYSGDDFKLAIVIKNQTTGFPINHTNLLNLLNVKVTSKNVNGYYFENMLDCNPSYFVGDINGEQFTDCMVIPDGIEYPTGLTPTGFGYISIYINAPVPSNPIIQAVQPLSVQQLMYTNVLQNCYIQFYFTSKVIEADNTVKFQVHRAHSSQFDVGSQFISASFQAYSGFRVTTMDDSILPWRNLRNYTTVKWLGVVALMQLYTTATAVSQGFQAGLIITNYQEVAVRYYDKCDQLLGHIGGGMYLLHLMFAVILNYINRMLLKMDLANRLMLKNNTHTTHNDYPANDKDLSAVTISPSYVLRGWLPICCQDQETVQMVEESQRYNDIVLLIKKQHVALRNLIKLQMNPVFQQKILKLQGEEEIYEESEESEESGGSDESQPELSNSLHIQNKIQLNSHLVDQPMQDNGELQSNINIRPSSSNSDPLNQEEGVNPNEIAGNRQQENVGNVPPVVNQEEVARMSIIIQQVQPQGQSNNGLVVQQNRQVGNIAASLPQNVGQKSKQTGSKQNNNEGQNNNEDDSWQMYRVMDPRQGAELNLSKTNSNNNRNLIESKQFIQIPQKKDQKETMKVVYHDQPLENVEAVNESQVALKKIPKVAQNTHIQPVLAEQMIPAATQNVLRQPPQLSTNIAINQTAGSLQPQRDDKFNLTSQQLDFVIKDRELVPRYFENNPTVQAMRNQKSVNYQNIMNLETYNKWNYPIIKHTTSLKAKCLAYVGETVCKGLRKIDMFSAPVDLIVYPQSSSCPGCCITLIIFILSICTFAVTCSNMINLKYRISYDYDSIDKVQLSRVTDNDFNLVVCFTVPSYMQGSTRTANFNYFTYINGVTTTIPPVQMATGDNTINFNSNQQTWLKSPISTASCYKMPNNVQVKLDQYSYFGYKITPLCTGTVSYCNTTQNVTNANFVTAMNNAILLTILPGSRFNDSSMTLGSDLYNFPYQTADYIYYNSNLVLEETVEVEKIVLVDDSQFSFMRSAPTVADANIDVDIDTKRSNFKAATASSPSYTFKVRPNQSQTTYTVYRQNICFIIGIIGGIFVLWYLFFKTCGMGYNRFNFNAYLGKVIYEQQGYDDYLVKKILAAMKYPDCLVPKCRGWRRDISRMKRVNSKIERSINHLSLLKYTDIQFYLSSCFFPRLQEKNLSLLHFRTLIGENDQVVGPVESRQREVHRESDFVNRDDLDQSGFHQTGNQIRNEDLGNQNMASGKLVEQVSEQVEVEAVVENQYDNIIPQKKRNFFLDIFEQQPTFTFRNQRQMSSVFGGVCCLIMVALVLIVVQYQVGLYLTNGGRTVSYETFIDDSITNPGSVQLLTGTNFRFGLAFINATTLSSFNITSYLNQIGISLLLQQFNRTNGIIVPTVKVADLVPCPTGYLQQWLSQSSDPTYFTNIQYAYCIPDNMLLEISGIPESQILKSFKVSIYNAMGNSTGYTTLTQLLNTSYVQYYFSTPQQNSINRTINYEINTMIFDYFPTKRSVTPVEQNITFSKLNITYADNAGTQSWIKDPLNQIAYAFDPFTTGQSQYSYSGNPNTDAWYNLSFSYSKRMKVYYITTPYFYEVFGMVGGVVAVFAAIIGCIAKSFNNYLLRYLIGRQFYVFQKLQKKLVKDKIRKKKMPKNETEERLIRQMNDLSEWDILMAYFASFRGDFTNDYNFSDNLRRVTLIQNKIQKDMNLVEFYKNLSGIRDALIKQFSKNPQLASKKITDIFLKHIHNPHPKDTHPEIEQTITKYARRHKFSSFEQMVAQQASNARVNIAKIFDNVVLEQIFNVLDSEGRSVRLSRAGSIGSLGSTSLNTSSVGSMGEHSVVGQNQ